MFVVLPVVLMIAASMPLYLISDYVPFTGLVYLFIPVLGVALAYWNLRRDQQKCCIDLGQLMREQGYRPGCCGRCGYDARSHKADACPECGELLAGVVPNGALDP